MNLEEMLSTMKLQTAAIVGLILAAVYYFPMFDGGASKVEQINAINTQVTLREAKLRSTQAALGDIEAFKAQVQESNAQFIEMLQFLPVSLVNQDVMLMLTKAVERVGGKVVNINALASEAASKLYTNHPFEIEFEATFAQSLTFLSDLTKIKQIINPVQISLAAVEGDSTAPLLRFKGLLVAYQYSAEQQRPSMPGDSAGAEAISE